MPNGKGRGGKSKGSGSGSAAGGKSQALTGAELAQAAQPYNEQLLWIAKTVMHARISGQSPDLNANAGAAGTMGGTHSLFEMPLCFKGMGVLNGREESSQSASSGAKLRILVKRPFKDIFVHIKWVNKSPSKRDAQRSSGYADSSGGASAATASAGTAASATGGGAQTAYDAKAPSDAKVYPSIAARAHAMSNASAAAPLKVTAVPLSDPAYNISAAAAAHAASEAAAPQPPTPASTTAAAADPPYPSVAAQVHAAHTPAGPPSQAQPETLMASVRLF